MVTRALAVSSKILEAKSASTMSRAGQMGPNSRGTSNSAVVVCELIVIGLLVGEDQSTASLALVELELVV